MSSRGRSLSMFVVQRTFRRVRRGYDPDEVDRHLELVSRWFASTEVGVALADERARLAEREHVLAQREKELRRSVEGTRLDGLTGVWLQRPPRKVASIGVHVSRWVTTHGYALNVDLDPAPFTDWITACGLEDAMFTTIARELDRPVSVDEVRPHAVAALEGVFGLRLEVLPHDEPGLWPQPLHAQLAAR